MKLTKQQLKQIIKEELGNVLEGYEAMVLKKIEDAARNILEKEDYTLYNKLSSGDKKIVDDMLGSADPSEGEGV